MTSDAGRGLSRELWVSPQGRGHWCCFCFVATQSAAGGCLAFSKQVVQSQDTRLFCSLGPWEVRFICGGCGPCGDLGSKGPRGGRESFVNARVSCWSRECWMRPWGEGMIFPKIKVYSGTRSSRSGQRGSITGDCSDLGRDRPDTKLEMAAVTSGTSPASPLASRLYCCRAGSTGGPWSPKLPGGARHPAEGPLGTRPCTGLWRGTDVLSLLL